MAGICSPIETVLHHMYDAEGNRISKSNSTNRELYTWDHRNRLTSVTQQEWDSVEQDWTTTQVVEYTYDYNNVWIRKVIGTDKTIFIPENYQTTVQINNGSTTHHYLWTPNQQDKLLADTTTSGILWALTDHLGTIRDVLDGNSSTHLIYDAFGNLTSGTNPLLFGYTGKAFDPATKLQNNINRWYDAAIGRWLSIDPIGFEGGDVNLYRYVRNYVINNIDSLGLFAGIVDSIDKKIHPFYCPECHQRFFPRHVKYAGKVTGQTYLHFGILGNARVTITASYGKNWNGWEEKEVKKKIESIFENQQQKDVKIFEADCNGGKIHWLKDSSKPDQDSRRKVTKTWEKSIKKSYRLMKDKTLKENDFLLGCVADVTVNVDIKFTFTASAELQAYHCCNEDS